MITCWSCGLRLPCDGDNVTDMLSRTVTPPGPPGVSCQPTPQGLPPETVITAEPVPPHGRYGGFELQAGTDAF